MNFEELMAMGIFALEKERSEEEAKKVMSFIKLNCLDSNYVLETPLSRKTRAHVIIKYLIDHIEEID